MTKYSGFALFIVYISIMVAFFVMLGVGEYRLYHDPAMEKLARDFDEFTQNFVCSPEPAPCKRYEELLRQVEHKRKLD